MKCQMCGHEQGVDEARDGEVWDMCGACGAKIIRFPKETLLDRLAKRDAFIERLIEAGSGIVENYLETWSTFVDVNTTPISVSLWQKRVVEWKEMR